VKESELLALIALSCLPDIGPHKVKTLVSHLQRPSKAFQLPKGKLLKIPGFGEKSVEAILNGKDQLKTAEDIIAQNHALGIETIPYLSDAYPTRLQDIKDAPLVLHYQGTASLNHPKTIAIVGTRKATTYGLDITKQLVKDLVAYDCQIISGLAYGIDIAAHKAALDNDLSTIGIMANGMDCIYPKQHLHTAQQMKNKGGLLTENKLGTTPDAPLFPARNRIIAGMADATIVVEATKKGGASITAEIANSYFRDVFAVPGNIYSPSSEGCNHLIKSNKAQLYTKIEDLEFFLNWKKGTKGDDVKKLKHLIDTSQLSEEGKKIVECLKEKPITIDELSWQSSIPVNQLAGHLLTLEFQDIVLQLPGKLFKLNA